MGQIEPLLQYHSILYDDRGGNASTPRITYRQHVTHRKALLLRIDYIPSMGNGVVLHDWEL